MKKRLKLNIVVNCGNEKLQLYLKRLIVEQNGVKFGSLGDAVLHIYVWGIF